MAQDFSPAWWLALVAQNFSVAKVPMSTFLDPAKAAHAALHSIRNVRTGASLAPVARLAVSRADRRRGLLGRDSLPAGHALILAPCTSIHTWFMRFPIDAVFVDREGVVLKICPDIRPWALRAAWGAHAVVELPAGASGGTRRGDRLELLPVHTTL